MVHVLAEDGIERSVGIVSGERERAEGRTFFRIPLTRCVRCIDLSACSALRESAIDRRRQTHICCIQGNDTYDEPFEDGQCTVLLSRRIRDGGEEFWVLAPVC